MATNFPASLDSYTTKVDNADSVLAAHINNPQDAIVALQTKVGVTSSATVTSHDYLLRNLPAQDTNWNAGASRNISCKSFTSVVGIGTPPFVATSTTVCTNFNADLLDGQEGSYYTNASNMDAGTLSIARGGTGVSTLAALGNLFYPVGSIYCNYSVATNPATLLGFGTWTSIGGKVLVGLDGSSEFATLGQTGGEKTHALTAAENGPHFHTVPGGNGGNLFGGPILFDATSTDGTKNTSTEGSGTGHNNLQPYIVIYMWYRSA